MALVQKSHPSQIVKLISKSLRVYNNFGTIRMNIPIDLRVNHAEFVCDRVRSVITNQGFTLTY